MRRFLWEEEWRELPAFGCLTMYNCRFSMKKHRRVLNLAHTNKTTLAEKRCGQSAATFFLALCSSVGPHWPLDLSWGLIGHCVRHMPESLPTIILTATC